MDLGKLIGGIDTDALTQAVQLLTDN